MAGNSRQFLGAERTPWLLASNKVEISVLQPQGFKFCQQPHGLGKGPRAPERNAAWPIPSFKPCEALSREFT